jgi:hypothetical protein
MRGDWLKTDQRFARFRETIALLQHAKNLPGAASERGGTRLQKVQRSSKRPPSPINSLDAIVDLQGKNRPGVARGEEMTQSPAETSLRR